MKLLHFKIYLMILCNQGTASIDSMLQCDASILLINQPWDSYVRIGRRWIASKTLHHKDATF